MKTKIAQLIKNTKNDWISYIANGDKATNMRPEVIASWKRCETSGLDYKKL